MSIKFTVLRPSAVTPTKRAEDAGIDLYACFDEDFLMINPHETVGIPTGIASAFPKEYVAIVKERGSTGSKGIGVRAGVVDSGFRGEWIVFLTNHNNTSIVIAKNPEEFERVGYMVYPYRKAIAQAVFVPLAQLPIERISPEELAAYTSERGDGMLGSSGK